MKLTYRLIYMLICMYSLALSICVVAVGPGPIYANMDSKWRSMKV